MEMPGAPRALREQGRRSFGVWHAGCLKCGSGNSRAPTVSAAAPLALFTLPLEGEGRERSERGGVIPVQEKFTPPRLPSLRSAVDPSPRKGVHARLRRAM